MTRLRLSLACGDYDRTRPLVDGRVRPEGVDLTVLTLEPEEMFWRMLRHHEFDVSELSLSSYVVLASSAESPFVALPVFPSRMFRHGAVYVNRHAGIRQPSDLAGKKVGMGEYQLTANVWVRGILSEHYGVAIDSVSYVVGGLNQPGREEKLPLRLPPGIDLQPCPPGKALSEMLCSGELDAIYSPRPPDCWLAGHPAVDRLFSDVRSVEQSFYRKTSIFPIMHLVVIRNDVYRADKWLATSLTKAFDQALEISNQQLQRRWAALAVSLPWAFEELRETQALMGEQFWTYGLKGNYEVLETFCRYSFEQGLSATLMKPEQLFAPEALEVAVI